MVIGDLLEEATLKLENDGIGDSYNEALILFTYALECNRTYIYVHRDEEVPKDNENIFREYMERRGNGEPTAYITGKAWFMNLEFNVNPSVLIPRPETEGLVETVIRCISSGNYTKPRILDMCTGSGCIGVSIADEIRDSVIDLADIEKDALSVAEGNILKHGLGDRVNVFHSNLFAGLPEVKYDIIVSNPPYIKDGDTKHLSEDVRKFEPHSALFAGEDGFSFYRRIINKAPLFMKENSFLILEAGFGQSDEIAGMLHKEGFDIVSIEKDLSGIPRVIISKSEK